MDISKAQMMARDLLRHFGLLQTGWTFSFDRAVWRLGVCKYSRREISLSKKLVEINSEDSVLDTILHEIAHALVGKGWGHSQTWKKKAVEIGCDGKRTAGDNHIAIPEKWVVFDKFLNKKLRITRNRRFAFNDNSRYEWIENK